MLVEGSIGATPTDDGDLRGIAIIGLAARFPGSPSLEQFEANLRAGADLISRFKAASAPGLDPDYVGARGVLEDPDAFDHVYFGISPAEAALIDPQQRIFLECAAHALGAAGYDPERYVGAIGVYAGVSTNTYVIDNVYPNFPRLTTGERFRIMVANDKDYLSTRLSHRLNLRGPSYSIQTACSTSLVAVHQACQGLLTGECDIALAGAATLRTPQDEGYVYEEGLVFSRSGVVRPFDDAADGTVMGNGVGVVVLKSLKAALADGDTVYAVIRGTAVNNDGAFKASFAAPSRAGQVEVVREALLVAGLRAHDISYVEAHGTGTRLGDPVEVGALSEAFANHTSDKGFCALGSVKSNLGHLDSAAGVAGLIKTVLMLRSKTLFPTRNFQRPNRAIAFEDTPFRVCDRLAPWESPGLRRAGVSSFGVGGTNAHVIVEEAPRQAPTPQSTGEQALMLSAMSQEALGQMKRDLAQWLRTRPDANLADVCFSLAIGRRQAPYRAAFVCVSVDEAIAILERSGTADDQIAPEARRLDLRVSAASDEFLHWARWAEIHDWRFRARLAEVLDPRTSVGGAFVFDDDSTGATAHTRFLALFATLAALSDLGLSPERSGARGLGALALAAVQGVLDPQEAAAIIAADPRLDNPAATGQRLAVLSARAQGSDPSLSSQACSKMLEDARVRSQERAADLSDRDTVVLVVGEAGAPERSITAQAAELWRAGVTVTWAAGEEHGVRRRIALPPYPFARVRHWLDAPGVREHVRTPARRSVLLDVDWLEAPAADGDLDPRRVGVAYTQATRKLAVAVGARFQAPVLMSVDDAANAAFGAADFDAWIDVTACDPLRVQDLEAVGLIGRALARLPTQAGRIAGSLLVVTNDPQTATGASSVAGAFGAALCRSLSHELPELRVRHCDLGDLHAPYGPGNLDDQRINAAADRIAREARLGEGHNWVRYHAGTRQAPRLRVRPLSTIGPAELSLDATDTALITGAGGGLGLLAARRLAQLHGVRRLVLGLRSPLPPRDAWSGDLSPSQHRVTTAIVELERQGVAVRVIPCTLNDAPALKAALDQVQTELGPVRVLIHAAGTADLSNTRFQSKDAADMQRVLAPKTVGLAILAECLDPEALKRVLLYSSVAALAPALAAGQADYAMANAHLDAAAVEGRLFGGKAVSIRWPSWRDTGMGEARSPAYVRTGLLSLKDEEGLRFFDAILTSTRTGVISPAIIDPQTFPAEALLDSRQALRPWRAGFDLSGTLREIAAGLLMIPAESLDESTPLQHYGADSILLVQMARRIGEILGYKVDVADLLEHASLSALAGWLALSASPRPEAVEARPSPELVAVLPVPFQAQIADRPASHASDRRVAIVGMACRFPGAPDIDSFWKLFEAGHTAIRPVANGRWRGGAGYFAGMIEELDRFDASFFGLSIEDVAVMDPQALLLLEESLKAIYHAGYDHHEWRGGRVGVYVGARGRQAPGPSELARSPNPILATSPNYLAANVSRFFDFQGPSLVVDTACSSALVALDLAVAALRAGEIETAIVAGVNVLETPLVHDLLSQRGILAPDGDFHIADQRAHGIVLGEGVGVVVMRTLDTALRARDQIHALVEGVAVNNDGRTAGPTTPNFATQKQVMARALQQSGRAPGDIVHVELNGSGSEVTDLLELRALEAVYRPGSQAVCSLGSVKPHIGHTLCAHGLASFIRAVLVLRHGAIPPFLSGQQPLKHYPLESSPFHFHRTTVDCPGGAVALSAFADGGTNAHVILGALVERNTERTLKS